MQSGHYQICVFFAFLYTNVMSPHSLFMQDRFLMYQKQTWDDNYVDFSRLFQEIHKFSCVLLYIWIRKNQTICNQATINLYIIFFPNFCLKREYSSGWKCILLWEFQPACKTNVHPRRLISVFVYTALISIVMRTCKGASVQADQCVHFL